MLLTTALRPWAFGIGVSAVGFFVAWKHVGERNRMAVKLSVEPTSVFWAHAADTDGTVKECSVFDARLVVLHFTDGTSIDVALPKEQMQVVMHWLAAVNPSVHFGALDTTEATTV